jgi:hypothetical protein
MEERLRVIYPDDWYRVTKDQAKIHFVVESSQYCAILGYSPKGKNTSQSIQWLSSKIIGSTLSGKIVGYSILEGHFSCKISKLVV